MSGISQAAIECLSKSLLGEELEHEQLGVLSGYMSPLAIPQGDLLIREGDMDHRLFVVSHGKFEAMRPRGQNPVSYVQIGPGEIVGEVGFLDGLARTANVRATTPSEVYSLARAEFERLSDEHPRIACAVLRALLRSVHRVVSRLTDTNVDLVGYIYT